MLRESILVYVYILNFVVAENLFSSILYNILNVKAFRCYPCLSVKFDLNKLAVKQAMFGLASGNKVYSTFLIMIFVGFYFFLFFFFSYELYNIFCIPSLIWLLFCFLFLFSSSFLCFLLRLCLPFLCLLTLTVSFFFYSVYFVKKKKKKIIKQTD